MNELEIEGIALLDVLGQARERLGNAVAAGERHGNRELQEAARSLIPVVELIRRKMASILAAIQSGRIIVAREEACALERELWKIRMSVESGVPPYFRRLIINIIININKFNRKICSED